MRKTLLSIVIALSVGLAMPATSHATPILSVVPSFQSGNIGDIFTVSLIISNLAAGEEIGGFDVDLTYDSSILAGLSITLGLGLGTGAEQFVVANSIPGGVADIAQFSFLSGSELKALQGSSFTLATLTFQGLANGFSPLTITESIFADGDLNTLQIAVNGQNGGIRIGPASVPEPSTVLLLGPGLGLLAWLRRRRQQ